MFIILIFVNEIIIIIIIIIIIYKLSSFSILFVYILILFSTCANFVIGLLAVKLIRK
jgi:hypothetical protein